MAENDRNNRSYAAAHFGLELDGSKTTVGIFKSIEGGSVTAEVMNYQSGDSLEIWRQLGKPKYEDFKVSCGMAMGMPFFDWMNAFVNGHPTRKNGAIIAADFFYVERARREFSEAMITEIAFPKLDASDKGPAFMTVTVSPEKVVFTKGSGEKLQFATAADEQKLWAACNFTFTIDGFQDAMRRCTKIDGFSVKQKPIEYHMGERREPIKVPGRIEWPTIAFYVPEVDAGPLIEAYMDYAADGNTDSPGRTGHIIIYDNSKQGIFSITLRGIHLKSAAPDKSDSGSEDIKQVKFEIAIESLEFLYDEELE